MAPPVPPSPSSRGADPAAPRGGTQKRKQKEPDAGAGAGEDKGAGRPGRRQKLLKRATTAVEEVQRMYAIHVASRVAAVSASISKRVYKFQHRLPLFKLPVFKQMKQLYTGCNDVKRWISPRNPEKKLAEPLYGMTEDETFQTMTTVFLGVKVFKCYSAFIFFAHFQQAVVHFATGFPCEPAGEKEISCQHELGALFYTALYRLLTQETICALAGPLLWLLVLLLDAACVAASLVPGILGLVAPLDIGDVAKVAEMSFKGVRAYCWSQKLKLTMRNLSVQAACEKLGLAFCSREYGLWTVTRRYFLDVPLMDQVCIGYTLYLLYKAIRSGKRIKIG